MKEELTKRLNNADTFEEKKFFSDLLTMLAENEFLHQELDRIENENQQSAWEKDLLT